MNANFIETKEMINISNQTMAMGLSVFEVKDGDFFVCIAPALLVSGYGKTVSDARQSFNDNIDFFCEALQQLPNDQKDFELYKLGFIKEESDKNGFSKAFVDQNGMLQNLDLGTLKTSRIELTA